MKLQVCVDACRKELRSPGKSTQFSWLATFDDEQVRIFSKKILNQSELRIASTGNSSAFMQNVKVYIKGSASEAI